MVASEDNGVVEERLQLIATDVFDPEEASQYGLFDDEGAAFGEEDENSL